jgi:hypothetical protein
VGDRGKALGREILTAEAKQEEEKLYREEIHNWLRRFGFDSIFHSLAVTLFRHCSHWIKKTTPRGLAVRGALVLLRHSDLALVELPYHAG